MFNRLRAADSRAKELGLAAAFLAIVATLAFLPHIRHGGFYSDDWADAAARFYPPGGPGLSHVLDMYAGLFPYRPVLILYVPLKYYVFGANISLQLSWTIALAVIIAWLLYGILRFFKLPWFHALAVAALTLVFPWFDSTRLWEAASLSSFAIALALAGFWLALSGLQRRSWRFHLVAATLYLVSILTYEITLPAIAAAGILYTAWFGWKKARVPWGVDLLVVLAAGIWNRTHTNRAVSGLGGDLHHLKDIVISGGTIVGRSVYPLGPHGYTTTALLLLAAVLGFGLVVWWMRGGSQQAKEWGLKQWLLLCVAGIGCAAVGWAMFIPADPYYTPSIYGATNRVNALSGFGLVIMMYAAIGIGVSGLATLVPRLRQAVPVLVVGAAVMLGAAYLHVLERHSSIWDQAYVSQMDGMRRIEHAFPILPHDTTLIAANYPTYQTLGVPIFSATWDLNGMIKMSYRDGSLSAFPLMEGFELVCSRQGVEIRGSGETPPIVPYGKVNLLDLEGGNHSAPDSRRQCKAIVGRYSPGPFYISYAY